MKLEATMQIHAAGSKMVYATVYDAQGRKVNVDRMMVKEFEEDQDFAAETKKNKMYSKSPPGWEGTVKHMKKHKDISNPWALSWWMKNKGYTSHKRK